MKIKTNVMKSTEVEVELHIPKTAKEWGLLTEGKVGADGAAEDLGNKLESLLSGELLEEETFRNSMNDYMNGLSFYGASDTEPRAVLQNIIHKVFGSSVSITVNLDGRFIGKIDVPVNANEKFVISEARKIGVFDQTPIRKLTFVPNKSLTIKTNQTRESR